MKGFDIALYIVGIILIGGIIFAPIAYQVGRLDGRSEPRSYPGFRRCRHSSHRRRSGA